MKKSSVSRMQWFVFSDSVSHPGKVNQNPTSNIVWEEHLDWFKDSSQYRILDTIDGVNIFQVHCIGASPLSPMYCSFHICVSIRKKISSRTLVIPRTWFRDKVVFHKNKDQEENEIESLNR